MAIDIIGIIKQRANAARSDASIVDKLEPSPSALAGNTTGVQGSLL